VRGPNAGDLGPRSRFAVARSMGSVGPSDQSPGVSAPCALALSAVRAP